MIALDQSLAAVLPAVIIVGVGLGIPYTVALVSAQRLYPAEPAERSATADFFAYGRCMMPVSAAGLSSPSGLAFFLEVNFAALRERWPQLVS